MDINELKERLSALRQRGYVVSLRKGNTGIGYTLETLLEVDENNLHTPDLGEVELKSQRKGVSNRITLFTFNCGAWKLPQKQSLKDMAMWTLTVETLYTALCPANLTIRVC